MNNKTVSIFWLVIISLVVALWSGGGVYMWQQSEKMKLNDQVKMLQSQIKEMVNVEPTGDRLVDEEIIDEQVMEDESKACALDVFECPDGSFVERVGPDCEFEACLE